MKPVILAFYAHAAALVAAGEVVIKKSVVAEHQVARVFTRAVIHGIGIPTLAQAEVAYPAVTGIFRVHGTRPKLAVHRGVFAVVPGQQQVALAIHFAVPVHHEVEAGAGTAVGAVYQAQKQALGSTVGKAHAVVEAALHEVLLRVI